MAWEERIHTIERNGESQLEQTLLNSASQDNGINGYIYTYIKIHIDTTKWQIFLSISNSST